MSEEERKAFDIAKEALADVLKSLSDLVKPGTKLLDLAELIEREIEAKGCMWAFPANICIGSIAAHYTPLKGEADIVPDNEIIKVDFGVCVDGYILDKAVSFYFGEDDTRKDMINVVNEALDLALSRISPGVQYMDIAGEVYDFVKSRGFNVISNLHGHKIERWKLHTDVEVPVHPESKHHGVFEEGEVYAIEIFVTDGEGFAESIDDVRIFSLPNYLIDLERFKLPIHLRAARELFNWVWRKRKTLPFSKRHLANVFDEATIRVGVAVLSQYGLLIQHNVLKEKKGVVAQAEDTIMIKKDGVEILTRP